MLSSQGRDVLLGTCVKCHDLRTVLLKPRTPPGWRDLVERMAEKPAMFTPMTDREIWSVTAYLIAISPDLARASRQRRQQIAAHTEAVAEIEEPDRAVAAEPASRPPSSPPPGAQPVALAGASRPAIDLAMARRTFETKCSQCHDLTDIDEHPPTSRAAASAIVKRMITDNEAVLSSDETALVVAWLNARYVDRRR